MGSLSLDQVQQLNRYSTYVDENRQTLFHLEQIFDQSFEQDFQNILYAMTKNENKTVQLSYFTKRYGMFISMQLYMLVVYDEYWAGDFSNLSFGIKEEFGSPSLCMFTNSADWAMIDEEDRQQTISNILEMQCYKVVQRLREMTAISPLLIWENIFGYIVWHFHVLLSNAATADEAAEYLSIFEKADAWTSFSQNSIFHTYTGGQHPSTLINVPIRKTCCHSKDIPGLLACSFCPLEKK